MKIQLEGKMYLMSNERQFMISEESEREVKDKLTGKMKTEVFMTHETFHQTIEGALTSYLDRKLRTFDSPRSAHLEMLVESFRLL